MSVSRKSLGYTSCRGHRALSESAGQVRTLDYVCVPLSLSRLFSAHLHWLSPPAFSHLWLPTDPFCSSLDSPASPGPSQHEATPPSFPLATYLGRSPAPSPHPMPSLWLGLPAAISPGGCPHSFRSSFRSLLEASSLVSSGNKVCLLPTSSQRVSATPGPTLPCPGPCSPGPSQPHLSWSSPRCHPTVVFLPLEGTVSIFTQSPLVRDPGASGLGLTCSMSPEEGSELVVSSEGDQLDEPYILWEWRASESTGLAPQALTDAGGRPCSGGHRPRCRCLARAGLLV